jgi:hypothetical protein
VDDSGEKSVGGYLFSGKEGRELLQEGWMKNAFNNARLMFTSNLQNEKR